MLIALLRIPWAVLRVLRGWLYALAVAGFYCPIVSLRLVWKYERACYRERKAAKAFKKARKKVEALEAKEKKRLAELAEEAEIKRNNECEHGWDKITAAHKCPKCIAIMLAATRKEFGEVEEKPNCEQCVLLEKCICPGPECNECAETLDGCICFDEETPCDKCDDCPCCDECECREEEKSAIHDGTSDCPCMECGLAEPAKSYKEISDERQILGRQDHPCPDCGVVVGEKFHRCWPCHDKMMGVPTKFDVGSWVRAEVGHLNEKLGKIVGFTKDGMYLIEAKCCGYNRGNLHINHVVKEDNIELAVPHKGETWRHSTCGDSLGAEFVWADSVCEMPPNGKEKECLRNGCLVPVNFGKGTKPDPTTAGGTIRPTTATASTFREDQWVRDTKDGTLGQITGFSLGDCVEWRNRYHVRSGTVQRVEPRFLEPAVPHRHEHWRHSICFYDNGAVFIWGDKYVGPYIGPNDKEKKCLEAGCLVPVNFGTGSPKDTIPY